MAKDVEENEEEEKMQPQERQRVTFYEDDREKDLYEDEPLSAAAAAIVKDIVQNPIHTAPETNASRIFGAQAISPLTFGGLAQQPPASTWRGYLGGLPEMTTMPQVQNEVWNDLRRPAALQDSVFHTPAGETVDRSQAYSTIRGASAQSRMRGEDVRDEVGSRAQVQALEMIRRGGSIPPHQIEAVLEAAQRRDPPSQERRVQDTFHDRMREAEKALQLRQREGEATGAITKRPQSTPKDTPSRPLEPPPRRNIFRQPPPVEREARQRERAPERNPGEPGPSAAEKLQLEMAMMLMKINNRLDSTSTSAPPPPRSNLKLQALQLPSVKRTASGEVSPREYHLWKYAVAHTISQNGISEQDILIHYSNNSKLLPEEWQIVFMQSTSLQDAIVTLDTFYPPVSDLSQELIMEMTKKGPVQNNSESTKLARVTSLL